MYERMRIISGQIKLRDFTIIEYMDGELYINRPNGEGGQFNKQEFNDAVAKFYDENF